MRAKRPLRNSGPSFNLAGLLDQAVPELQVQQKNEQELNKFFIDVDDNTVSPMITTGPSFRTANMANPSDVKFTVDETAEELSLRDVSRSSEQKARCNGEGLTAAGGTSPPLQAIVSASNEAKFIHVNNTNIFVLIDGISMFVEGKSTFTGTEDARLLAERLRQKRLARSVDTVQEAILNIEGSAESCASKIPARAPPSAISSLPGVVAAPSPSQRSPKSTGVESRPLIGRCISSLSRQPPRSVKIDLTTNLWASLFKDARRPSSSPLFRTFRAEALSSNSTGNSVVASMQSTQVAKETIKDSILSSPVLPVSPTITFSATTSSSAAPRDFPSSTSAGLLHQDSTSSVLSATPAAGHRYSGNNSRDAVARRAKPISAEEIGRSNRSLDMDEVVIEEMIGKGTQGTVFRVRVDGKVYALKCMNIAEAMNATNDVERQGRKKGLVKELTMITLQRSRLPPAYLMQMFNAVASLDAEKKQLSILLELMSFTVENIKQMVSRIPIEELMRITQSTFRKYISGNPSAKQMMKERCKDQMLYGSPRHVLGRSTYKEPAAWEKSVKRETPMPEVFLSMLAHDVLMGLNELHTDYSIIHCDVKPSNVLICYDQQKFKLADFGCGCVMENRQHVERRGLDLGTMLYKAPERFAASMPHRIAEIDDDAAGEAVVAFTAKADVWSLGIMLMELASGIHPCEQFKSDFWNYGNMLRLSKMIKPLNWSETFHDFILRSVCEDTSMRWSAQDLLKHPFVIKFNHVPREKLKQFVQRLEAESKTFHKRQQSALLKEQILLSTTRRHKDTFQLQSKKVWSTYTAYLKHAPPTKDETMFPELRYQ